MSFYFFGKINLSPLFIVMGHGYCILSVERF